MESKTVHTPEIESLIAAIELALPYVDKVANTLPTTNSRLGRKIKATQHAREIRTAIAKAKGE